MDGKHQMLDKEALLSDVEGREYQGTQRKQKEHRDGQVAGDPLPDERGIVNQVDPGEHKKPLDPVHLVGGLRDSKAEHGLSRRIAIGPVEDVLYLAPVFLGQLCHKRLAALVGRPGLDQFPVRWVGNQGYLRRIEPAGQRKHQKEHEAGEDVEPHRRHVAGPVIPRELPGELSGLEEKQL